MKHALAVLAQQSRGHRRDTGRCDSGSKWDPHQAYLSTARMASSACWPLAAEHALLAEQETHANGKVDRWSWQSPPNCGPRRRPRPAHGTAQCAARVPLWPTRCAARPRALRTRAATAPAMAGQRFIASAVPARSRRARRTGQQASSQVENLSVQHLRGRVPRVR